jgi:hypothetical protein
VSDREFDEVLLNKVLETMGNNASTLASLVAERSRDNNSMERIAEGQGRVIDVASRLVDHLESMETAAAARTATAVESLKIHITNEVTRHAEAAKSDSLWLKILTTVLTLLGVLVSILIFVVTHRATTGP